MRLLQPLPQILQLRIGYRDDEGFQIVQCSSAPYP